ncbi:cytochrome c oxidase subunit II [Cytobacillus firmus]|jgi:cytochrome c oxidase subunit II|uniref:Cytochrome aa3 subunit 2 n=2 Tax=Bacillaceae TaxID=186817 RepID=A0AA46SLP4_CYTFI|nr:MULTISPECIES: cytochrome c oxidase subunit II [Bacillales]MBG9445979.1 cytochrome c oxidase subunit II [Cytobacillus firmus]MBG9449093.1 cytochrome c oxidase subunit II [Cytobacillus firmus]MBY6053207.1 cytochrome c oxidase subunit II [Cytobacillus firmus]MCC3648860.1 cytochrome c oxidase subunit II [Cytobacillus oceanisediminis]MCS0655209.1 cytochrome c oxidase subunit II [Cytobacillus firmus]
MMHRSEKVWLILSFGMIIGFMLIAGYQAFAFEMGPPSYGERIDPQKVDETAPFDKPGIKKIGDNEYEVVMTLQVFSFTPSEIEVPAGSTVHFTLTSKDVVHGFQVAETNLNAMVVPGYVQKITQKFDKPGEYLVLCNEYCGAGHQMMSTTITVK